MLLFSCVLLLLCVHRSVGEKTLGDSLTSKQSEADLFSDLDINGNGRISEAELFEFVQETGGDSLDERQEVDNAVTSVMSVLDDNHDKVFKKDDLSKYMKSLASLLPLDEVARWVAHAQQMPQDVVQSFIDNGITGYDFPELIQDNGILLEKELGIQRLSLRRRLCRGMRMKLLGMGNHPPPPQLLALTPSSTEKTQSSLSTVQTSNKGQRCEKESVLIQWGYGDTQFPHFLSNNDMDFPVHKYQLYREHVDSEGDNSEHYLFNKQRLETHTLGGKDILIYEGMEMFYKDRLPAVMTSAEFVTFTYRLVAWNVIGRSEYTVIEHVVPRMPDHCFTRKEALSVIAPVSESYHTLSGSSEWDDNSSAEILLGRHQTNVKSFTGDINKISPMSCEGSDNAGIKYSFTTVALETASGIFSSISNIFYVINITLVALSFMLSVFFAVLRIKSMYVYNDAISRRQEDVSGDYSDIQEGNDKDAKEVNIITLLLQYLLVLDPVFVWMQRSVLAPVLCFVAPSVSRRLEALAVNFPSCKPMSNFLLGALRSFLKLVLEVGDESIGSEEASTPKTYEVTSSGGNVARVLTRTTSGLSTDSNNSENSQTGSYNHCSICQAKVTNKIFSTYIKNKLKRHHCCQCAKIFCRNCGSVDHSDIMQCQVPGKCICQNCKSETGGHSEVKKVSGSNKREDASRKLPARDRPPLYVGSNCETKRVVAMTKSKKGFSIFGLRNRTPSPPLRLRLQSDTEALPSSIHTTSTSHSVEDIPDLVRSSTSPSNY